MAATASVIEQAARALRVGRWVRGGHPLAPAALRVERTRSRGRAGESSEQTALTLWFGEGPGLPVPSGNGGRAVRVVGRAALAVIGAAAVGALGALAGQRELERLPAAVERRRIAG